MMKLRQRGDGAIRSACIAALSTVAASTCFAQPAPAPKGQKWLIKHGLQIQGMARVTDPFNLATYQGLNYTAVNFLWDSDVSELGAAPGAMPWAKWVHPGANPPGTAVMPPVGAEAPYMSNLIALSLGDEPNLNNDTIRQQYIDWFNAVRASFPNQLLYMNNYGGQVTDIPLGDFIVRGQPDMISFDTYPYRFTGPNTGVRVQPSGGSPTNLYGDLRRYRQHARDNNIPLGVYRQTYQSITEGVRAVSESELRLLTFAPLAFNAKYLTDFTYNTGASIFFNNAAGGDNSPNALYTAAAQINAEARRLGPALVRLKPVSDHVPGGFTTGVMFIRGKHDVGGTPTLNPVPIGFYGDAGNPNANYTEWVFGVNDPYLSGPFNDAGTTNLGTFNNGLDGDVILSWFTPADEWYDGDDWSNQRYLMVTNGLADMDATGAQTRQRIKLNFGSSGVKYPYTSLQKLDRTSGQIVSVPLNQLTGNVWQLDIEIDGGTSELFKFPTGAPFVGTLGTDVTWSSSVSGNFSNAANWDTAVVPSAGSLLHFGSTTAGAGPAYTVTFSGSVTANAAFVHRDNVTLNLNNHTLTLAGVSGLDNLIVGMSSGESASLTVLRGTLVTSANPAYFAEIGKAAGAVGTLTLHPGQTTAPGHWSSAVDVLIGRAGTGTLNVSGSATASLPNVYLGGTPTAAGGGTGVMNLSGGTTSIAGTLKVWNSGPAAPGGSRVNLSGGTLSVGSLETDGNPARFNWTGGMLEFTGGDVTIGPGAALGSAISLGAGKTLRLDDIAHVLRVAAGGDISFSGGKIDLNDKAMIVSAGALGGIGSWNGAAYTGITGQIASGRNAGAWNGAGITTTQADAAGGLTTLAVATAEAAGNVGETFMGQSISAGDVLVMYTYAGDANLDGFISGDDYSAIDFASGVPGSSGYANGDFNFDGVISGDDYSMIDFNLVAQGAPFPTSRNSGAVAAAAVPEPATVALAVIVMLAGGGARRRRRRAH